MNVRLATQVLSSTVSVTLGEYGPQEAKGTAKFCELMDTFFDCMNVRNCQEHIHKLKPFLKPYSSVNDECLVWLSLADWKQCIFNRPGNFTDSARSAMFISRQTYEGLQISCLSMVEYLLSSGIPYILTERFCQDPLENYFGESTFNEWS